MNSATMTTKPTLFEDVRMTLEESIRLTIASIAMIGQKYRHWAIAYSGGKDSTATVTLIAYLLQNNSIPKPSSLTVLYADTRMELPPLRNAAINVLKTLEKQGIKTQIVLPNLDDRFFVYMFGRGVPPPKNRFRWCTAQIKIEPMLRTLSEIRETTGEKLLMFTGVRLGESAARDARIALSCSRDGAECGQGWFQKSTPEAVADTLAPLIHFRVCHVWDWLFFFAPGAGFPSSEIAEIYGMEENTTDIAARTGCVGCPLASRDATLERLVRKPQWSYLSPLLRLRDLYTDLSFNHANRLRKTEMEYCANGEPVKNPQRIGPLTMSARQRGVAEVLAIQAEVNESARRLDRPTIDLFNSQEVARTNELITANTWPNRWDGTETPGNSLINIIHRDGSEQPLLDLFVE